MPVITPNSLLANKTQLLSNTEEEREIIVGPMVIPVGGTVVGAANDIVQLSPEFLAPRQLKYRLARLDISLSAGLAGNTDELVLVGQVSGNVLSVLDSTVDGTAGEGVTDAEYQALAGTVGGGSKLTHRVYDGGFIIGLKRGNANNIPAGDTVTLLMAYTMPGNIPATHKASDGSAYS